MTIPNVVLGEVASEAWANAVADVVNELDVLTVDGQVLTRAAGVPASITRANLAADAAFTARYVPLAGGVLLTDAAQSIPTSSVTDITWGTEVSDPDGWTSGGIATLTVPAGKAGRYIVTYSGTWSASPTSQTIACNINSTPTYEVSPGSLGVGTNFVPTLTFVRTFAVADTIKFTAAQSSGSARDLTSRLEIAPA